MLKAHHRCYLAAFLLDFAVSSGFTAFPFFIFDHLGGDARMSGWISAIQSACYGAVCILSSTFVGRARNGLIWAQIGSLGYALIFPAAILFRNPIIIAAMTIAGVTCMALFWPALQSWIGSVPDLRLRSRRIAHYNISWSLGLATSPLLAGPLYDMHYSLPFVLVFVSALLSFALVMSLPHELSYFGAATPEDLSSRAEHTAISEAHLHCTWLASFVGWAMVGVMRSVFPKRVHELAANHDLVVLFGSMSWERLNLGPATQTSWLILMLYASRVITTLDMGHRHTWHHKFRILVVWQIAAALAFLGLGISHSLFVMAICCLIIGANGAVSFFASLYYSVANPAFRHGRTAIHEGMVGVGGFVGSVAFGELASRLGTSWPFVYTPVFVAVCLAGQWLLFRRGMERLHRSQSELGDSDSSRNWT
ncbi:MAG: hypothetical protein K1Y02_01820 [Candidatus Hydrogenedentes bacterium]|nr:hypothetical protein [Candidatus Hydrogenedentota bacterium]